VISDKNAQTITVEVTRRFPAPKYGKMVRQDRRFRAHDQGRTARVGDVVEIQECRPMSRTKRWRLVKVLERNPEQAAAAAPPAEATPAS
jgi:small subunit ribosomal protein S17